MFRLVYQPIRALIWNQISKKWVFWSAKLWLNPSIVFFLCLDNWQPTSQVDIRYFQYFHRKLEFVYFVEVMLSRAKVHIKTDSSWIKRCKVNLRHIIFHTFFLFYICFWFMKFMEEKEYLVWKLVLLRCIISIER